MDDQGDRAGRMEALRRVLDRLCATDLTLAEAKDLREQLFGLLGRAPRDEAADRAVP
jgi:hypothetical protein